MLLSRSLALADGPLLIVAPAAPGGGWDQTARALQRVLTTLEPSRRVQVDNVPGAAGTIGLARFVSAERGNPDALLVTGLVMVSAIVTNGAPVTLADTTPIARLTGEFEVIVVPAASPYRTLDDLLRAFRARPASVAWGGGSAGGTDDLLVRLVADAVGVAPRDVNYIAFAGGGAALGAVLGGQVTAGVSGYGEFAGQIAAGTLRLLAVSSPARVPGIDAPTLVEQGVNVELSNWRAVVAPPGLSDAERGALTARVERAARSAEWRDVLARNGWDDLLLTGPAFRQFLLAERQRVEAVLVRLQPDGGTATTLSPTMAPLAAGIAFVALLIRVVATTSAPVPWTSLRRPAALAAALGLHALLFPVAGFIPVTTGLFLFTARLFGSRRPVRDAAVGLLLAVTLFVTFTHGLGVLLPVDPLTRGLAP